MSDSSPKIIDGGLSVDDRGKVSFVNDFDFKDIKRFYVVENHRKGFVRAWHAHQFETKYAYVISGSVKFALIKVENWDKPALTTGPDVSYLSSDKPAVLHIPAGWANGFKTLSDDAKIIFYSDKTLEESLGDDVRFSAEERAYTWEEWER